MKLSRDGMRKLALLQVAGLVPAAERTAAAMASRDAAGQNAGRAFLRRAAKSDARRRIEKATRKKMRRRK